MYTDFSTGKIAVVSEKRCVITENRDVSVFLFHPWHIHVTEQVGRWGSEHLFVGNVLPLHSEDQGPGHPHSEAFGCPYVSYIDFSFSSHS